MTLQSILEEDRNTLIGRLGNAPDLPAAADAVADEFGRILMRYSGEEENEAVRQYAQAALLAVKGASALADSSGEPVVYERDPAAAGLSGRKAARMTPVQGVCLGAGLALMAVQIMLYLLPGVGAQGTSSAAVRILLLILCALSFYAAGGGIRISLPGRRIKAQRPQGSTYALAAPDAEKIYHHMLASVLQIDHLLENVRTDDALKRKRLTAKDGGAGTDKGAADGRLIDLLSGILENVYAEQESESAGEIARNVSYYFHTLGIETLDYSEETADLFECMPAYREMTIRPALRKDGKLLKKGIAGLPQRV